MSSYLVRRSEEGTSSPFVGRMFLGILELRDLIVMTNNHPENIRVSQEQFDRLYEPVRSSLEITLEASRSLNNICIGLIEAGKNGELAISYPNGGVEVINTKDTIIQKEFASVIEHSAIAIKNHLPKLLDEIFDINIGPIYQNDEKFEEAVKRLNSNGLIPLSHYLQSVRFWSNQLINGIWNQTKHSTWRLKSPELRIISLPVVQVDIPKVFDIPVNEYAYWVINRCCTLVEDLIVYGIQFHRFSPIGIVEINERERHRYHNSRFMAIPKYQGFIPLDPTFTDNLDIL